METRRSRRHVTAAALVVACVLAAGGCGDSDDDSSTTTKDATTAATVDSSAVESQIKKQLSSSATEVTKVGCPDDVKSKTGATFKCDVTWSNGAAGQVKVTAKGANQFTYDVVAGSVQILGESVNKTLEKQLAHPHEVLIVNAIYLTVGLSVLAHGISAAPLTNRYAGWYERHRATGVRRRRALPPRSCGRAVRPRPPRRRLTLRATPDTCLHAGRMPASMIARLSHEGEDPIEWSRRLPPQVRTSARCSSRMTAPTRPRPRCVPRPACWREES